MTRKNVM